MASSVEEFWHGAIAQQAASSRQEAVRRERAEGRGRKADDRWQKAESRDQRSEVKIRLNDEWVWARFLCSCAFSPANLLLSLTKEI
jgi:hypothetical protein